MNGMACTCGSKGAGTPCTCGRYVCADPEGEWIVDQEQEAGWSRGEHLAEARAVEAHQEEKHGDF